MNKLPGSTIVALSDALFAGQSGRQIAASLSISKQTVSKYRGILGIESMGLKCSCGKAVGHQGWCSYRIEKSPARQAFLSRWTNSIIVPSHRRAERQAYHAGRASVLPINRFASYPYVHTQAKSLRSGELTERVLALLPRGVPPELRGDVCQELIALILEGEIGEVDVQEYAKVVIRQQRSPYHPRKFVSLDEQKGDTGLTWSETISNEYYRDRIDEAMESANGN